MKSIKQLDDTAVNVLNGFILLEGIENNYMSHKNDVLAAGKTLCQNRISCI